VIESKFQSSASMSITRPNLSALRNARSFSLASSPQCACNRSCGSSLTSSNTSGDCKVQRPRGFAKVSATFRSCASPRSRRSPAIPFQCFPLIILKAFLACAGRFGGGIGERGFGSPVTTCVVGSLGGCGFCPRQRQLWRLQFLGVGLASPRRASGLREACVFLGLAPTWPWPQC